MHFTGMMAYHVPVAMSYGMLLTLISMIPGMVGAGFAIMIHDRTRIDDGVAADRDTGLHAGTKHHLHARRDAYTARDSSCRMHQRRQQMPRPVQPVKHPPPQ